MLNVAGSDERSEHPLARAIDARARETVTQSPVSTFAARPVRGVRGVVDGIQVEVVGPRRLRERGIEVPATAPCPSSSGVRGARRCST